MITNAGMTLYHKGYDLVTRLETWTRYNFSNVWWFGNKGATVSEGYTDNDTVQVRIPYFEGLDTSVLSLGDIIVKGIVTQDIQTQQDLKMQVYNITSINDNSFGNNPHIHLIGQ